MRVTTERGRAAAHVQHRIEPARSADLPAIVALLLANKLPRAGIEGHISTTLVARVAGRLVGCAAIEPYGAAGLLRSVAVEPAVRGRGLGQALSQAALDLARGRGIKTVYLLTETAGGFFARFGFRTISRTEVDPAVQRSVEFTSACPTSALVMQADL
jgi:amino-acid N-acetyltransferase